MEKSVQGRLGIPISGLNSESAGISWNLILLALHEMYFGADNKQANKGSLRTEVFRWPRNSYSWTPCHKASQNPYFLCSPSPKRRYSRTQTEQNRLTKTRWVCQRACLALRRKHRWSISRRCFQGATLTIPFLNLTRRCCKQNKISRSQGGLARTDLVHWVHIAHHSKDDLALSLFVFLLLLLVLIFFKQCAFQRIVQFPRCWP